MAWGVHALWLWAVDSLVACEKSRSCREHDNGAPLAKSTQNPKLQRQTARFSSVSVLSPQWGWLERVSSVGADVWGRCIYKGQEELKHQRNSNGPKKLASRSSTGLGGWDSDLYGPILQAALPISKAPTFLLSRMRAAKLNRIRQVKIQNWGLWVQDFQVEALAFQGAGRICEDLTGSLDQQPSIVPHQGSKRETKG